MPAKQADEVLALRYIFRVLCLRCLGANHIFTLHSSLFTLAGAMYGAWPWHPDPRGDRKTSSVTAYGRATFPIGEGLFRIRIPIHQSAHHPESIVGAPQAKRGAPAIFSGFE